MGIIHHSFRAQRNDKSSHAMEILERKPLAAFILILLPVDHDRLKGVNSLSLVAPPVTPRKCRLFLLPNKNKKATFSGLGENPPKLAEETSELCARVMFFKKPLF